MAAVTLKLPKDKPHHPLTAALSITLPVRPTTKKTSNRVIAFKKKVFNPKTRQMEMRHQHAVLPSEDYVEFERTCVSHAATICGQLRRQGVQLPITSPISIRALIYREKRVGDHTGFTQAIGDVLKSMDIILDDRIIEHWDGTRRLHDKARPRVELLIQPVGGDEQEEMF
jgi:hypothetical protein